MSVVVFTRNENFRQLNLWVIPVAITGGQRTITFDLLLDTGAQRTVLSFDVKDLVGGVEETGDTVRGSGMSNSSQYPIGRVRNLEIGLIALGSLDILLGSLPNPFKRKDIDGVLGADVLCQLHLNMDYPEGLLVIRGGAC